MPRHLAADRGVEGFTLKTDAACWIRIAGEVDIANRFALEDALDPTSVILDCTELTFMDSSRFAALVVAYTRAKKNGTEFCATGMTSAPCATSDLAPGVPDRRS